MRRARHGLLDARADLDGDGFVADSSCTTSATGAAGDCDDRSDAISPAATEACNARDDDCDGRVDEGLGCDGVAEVRVGTATSCARLASGTVACWGRFTGQGTAHVPVDVPEASGAVSIDVGWARACAALASGEVRCWGEREVEAPVEGVSDAVQVAIGGRTCARHRDGRVSCWDYFRPWFVPLVEEAIDLDAASDRACAVTREGRVWCWAAPGSASRVGIRCASHDVAR